MGSDEPVYLINENSNESAAYYDAKVAAVLLQDSVGWHVADPSTGKAIETPEQLAGDPGADASAGDLGLPGAQADASTAAAGGQVPSDTPAGAPADNPKE